MNNFSPNANNPYYTAGQTQAGANTLIQRVSYLLCTALLVTAAAAWWAGPNLSPALFLPLALGTIVCVVALNFTRANPASEPRPAVRSERPGRLADGAAA